MTIRGSRRFAAGREGIALITAIWLTVIGVMLVTTLATIIMGNVVLATNIAADAKARMGAQAGIEKAIAELIADRPNALLDTPGVIITEIQNCPADYIRSLKPLHSSATYLGSAMDTSFEFCANDQLWVRGGSSLSAIDTFAVAQPLSGSRALRFTSLTAGFAQSGSFTAGRWVRSCTVAVSAGDTVNAGSWVYADGIEDDQVQIAVEWRNSSGTCFDSDATQFEVDSYSQWIKLETRAITAPAGTVGATLFITARYTVTSSTVDLWFDNAYIAAGNAKQSTRRYEYIEIQNCDTVDHNMVTDNYWISVGDSDATSKRYIYPIDFKSTQMTMKGDLTCDSTLKVGAVGIIIPDDADTVSIAALSGYKPGSIHWFGLRSASGVYFDHSLGKAGVDAMRDTAETVIIGFGNTTPVKAPYWFGVPLPDSGVSITETSWQKSSYHRFDLDDTDALYTNLNDSTWSRKYPTPGIGIVTSARLGVDGAIDTWYTYNYDTYYLIDTSSYDIYYRTRIFDEGAKININYLHHGNAATSESAVLVNLLCANIDSPFKSMSSYWDPAGTYRTGFNNAYAFADAIISARYSGGKAGADSFLTPNSVYTIWADSAAGAGSGHRGQQFDTAYVPFVTEYGYNEAGVFPINVNMAETPVLRAALIWALVGNNFGTDSVGSPWAGISSASLGTCRDSAARIADQVYKFLTSNDNDRSNDTVLYKESDIARCTTDTAQVEWAYINGRLSQILTTASTNYFMIYSTGFAFKKGANVNTDTPVSQNRIIAIVKRYSDADKADVIFWRETMEIATPSNVAVSFPIGVWRYPRYKWDISI